RRGGVDGAWVGRVLEGDGLAPLDQEGDGEADGLLSAVGDEDLLGGGGEAPAGQVLGDGLLQRRVAVRGIAMVLEGRGKFLVGRGEEGGGEALRRWQVGAQEVDAPLCSLDDAAEKSVAMEGLNEPRLPGPRRPGEGRGGDAGAAALAPLDEARFPEPLVGGDDRATTHPDPG